MLSGDRGLELRSLDDYYRFAGGVIASGLAPSSFKTVEAVMVAMQYGAEIGFSPMQSLQLLAVINGKPTLYGDALPALAWGSGLLEELDEFIEGTGDDMVATCAVKRRGVVTRIIRTFSVADARSAGLLDKAGPWKTYRSRMLAMRARAFAFRDGFADVLRGCAVREEVEDYPVKVEAAPYSLPTVGTPVSTGSASPLILPTPIVEKQNMAAQFTFAIRSSTTTEQLEDVRGDLELCLSAGQIEKADADLVTKLIAVRAKELAT